MKSLFRRAGFPTDDVPSGTAPTGNSALAVDALRPPPGFGVRPPLRRFSATRATPETFATPTRHRTVPKAGEGSRTPRRDRAHRALPDLRQFLQCVHPSGALKFGREICERIGFASGIGRANVVALGDERTPTKVRRPFQRREPCPSVRAVAVCSCSGQTAP